MGFISQFVENIESLKYAMDLIAWIAEGFGGGREIAGLVDAIDVRSLLPFEFELVCCFFILQYRFYLIFDPLSSDSESSYHVVFIFLFGLLSRSVESHKLRLLCCLEAAFGLELLNNGLFFIEEHCLILHVPGLYLERIYLAPESLQLFLQFNSD